MIENCVVPGCVNPAMIAAAVGDFKVCAIHGGSVSNSGLRSLVISDRDTSRGAREVVQ